MTRATADFLRLYEEELQFLRESGTQFASDHPALGHALGLKESADPSIDRLLEGVAFLSARVRLKLATSERQVANELLSALAPVLVQPIPSVAIIAASPELGIDQISMPVTIPRGAAVKGHASVGGDQCEFRTCQSATLYPWRISEVQFLGGAALATWREALPRSIRDARSAIRIGLDVGVQAQANGFDVKAFALFVNGEGALPSRLIKALLLDATGVVVIGNKKVIGAHVGAQAIQPIGFEADQVLFDRGHSQYAGHRVLAEFFAMTERFQFVNIALAAEDSLRIAGATRIDVLIPLARDYPGIAEDVEKASWELDAIPVVNEYTCKLDRMPWSAGQVDIPLIVDRLRSTAHEVLQVVEVVLYGKRGETTKARSVLDSSGEFDGAAPAYHVHRRIQAPWRMRGHARTEKRTQGTTPSTMHLAVVGNHGPVDLLELDQVSVTARVCDGDRPQAIWRAGGSRWSIDASGGLRVRMLTPPTSCTRAHLASGDEWALVSTLRQSLESLLTGANGALQARLKRILGLFAVDGSARNKRIIEAIRDVSSRPSIRAVPGGGPLAYCRGIEITLETATDDLDSTQLFLLSMVLDRYLGGHCSINGFTQLSVKTPLMETSWKWPARRGLGELL